MFDPTLSNGICSYTAGLFTVYVGDLDQLIAHHCQILNQKVFERATVAKTSPKYKMTELDLPSLILIFFIIQDGLVLIMAVDGFVAYGDNASVVIIGVELFYIISGEKGVTRANALIVRLEGIWSFMAVLSYTAADVLVTQGTKASADILETGQLELISDGPWQHGEMYISLNHFNAVITPPYT